MLNQLRAATFAARRRKMPEGASSEAATAELYGLAKKAIEDNDTFYILDNMLAGLAKTCSGAPGGPTKIHAVCSIDRAEGKSTISLALAAALARRGDVLLVEADLRHPTLAADLGRYDKPCLEDFLRQRIPLENAIQQTPVDRLRIITASASQPSAQRFPFSLSTDEPAYLLGQPVLRQSLERLRSSYSTIVIDMPALSGGEAIPLMEMLDGVILVIKAGQTSKERMERAVSVIGREKLVGVVINNVRYSAPWWLRRILSEDGESA